MRYLTVSEVARFNARYTGEDAPFDFGLLESAVLRPQTTVGGMDAFPTLHDKAAALFHSLVRNHAFFNANKRTAVSAVSVFYALNGWQLELPDDAILALALDAAEESSTSPRLRSGSPPVPMKSKMNPRRLSTDLYRIRPVAAYLEVSHQRADQMFHEGKFPEADRLDGIGPMWKPATIERWARREWWGTRRWRKRPKAG